MHTELCRCLVLSPSCGLYSFRAQNKTERLSPVDLGISREESPTCILHGGSTHPVTRAMEVSHKACNIYEKKKFSPWPRYNVRNETKIKTGVILRQFWVIKARPRHSGGKKKSAVQYTSIVFFFFFGCFFFVDPPVLGEYFSWMSIGMGLGALKGHHASAYFVFWYTSCVNFSSMAYSQSSASGDVPSFSARGGDGASCPHRRSPLLLQQIVSTRPWSTDRDSLRYTYNGTRRVRQLALGCESNWVKSAHDAYKNTWKCGELKLYFSPSAGGWKKKKKKEEKKVWFPPNQFLA